MRKTLPYIIAALVVAALLGAGWARVSPPKQAAAGAKGNAARGKVYFDSTCALCHGVDGRGKPKLGMNLVEQSDWMKQQTDAMLVAFIKEGRSMSTSSEFKMPMLPRGGDPNLTDRDLADIVAYIRLLQKQ